MWTWLLKNLLSVRCQHVSSLRIYTIKTVFSDAFSVSEARTRYQIIHPIWNLPNEIHFSTEMNAMGQSLCAWPFLVSLISMLCLLGYHKVYFWSNEPNKLIEKDMKAWGFLCLNRIANCANVGEKTKGAKECSIVTKFLLLTGRNDRKMTYCFGHWNMRENQTVAWPVADYFSKFEAVALKAPTCGAHKALRRPPLWSDYENERGFSLTVTFCLRMNKNA